MSLDHINEENELTAPDRTRKKGESGREQEKVKEHKKKGNWNYLRDRDRQKVKGKFIFHEVPGGQMSFVFKAYKGDPIERFTLVDGEIYELPLGVAKHLNKNCWYPVHHWSLDSNGKPSSLIGKKVRRCSFQSLEFVDIEDMTPATDIITVTPI